MSSNYFAPTVIVTDASVLVPALCDAGGSGDRARARLLGVTVAAPELVDLECLSAIRGLALSRKLTDAAAQRATAMLVAAPIRRSPHQPLLARCWQLRSNLTAYDASYVALAELLGVTLVTADKQLAQAPGLQCPVEILAVAG